MLQLITGGRIEENESNSRMMDGRAFSCHFIYMKIEIISWGKFKEQIVMLAKARVRELESLILRSKSNGVIDLSLIILYENTLELNQKIVRNKGEVFIWTALSK